MIDVVDHCVKECFLASSAHNDPFDPFWRYFWSSSYWH